jgi:hypothetical protein
MAHFSRYLVCRDAVIDLEAALALVAARAQEKS